MSKKTYILIAFLFVLALIFVIIKLLGSSGKNAVIQPENVPIQSAAPFINYSPGSLKKDYERFKERTPLSSADQAAKDRLIYLLKNPSPLPESEDIESFGAPSGILYSNSNIEISYFSAPDDFEVEILNSNILLAKNQAEDWFIRQGFSKEGICALPVTFSLSSDAQSELQQGVEFDPNPTGCN